MSDLEQIALTLLCPACGAEPGDWCRTFRPTFHAPGRRAAWLHVARTQAPSDAWGIGYANGYEQALHNVAWNLRAAREGAYWTKRDGVPRLLDDAVERWLERLAERRA